MAEALEISSESREENLDLIEVLGNHEQIVGRKPFPCDQDLKSVVHRKSGIVHCLRSERSHTVDGTYPRTMWSLKRPR